MDVTALQSTIQTLTAQKEQQEAALAGTNNELATANQQLADANVINYLEGLDAAGIEALNATLAADPQNTNAVSVSFPAQGAQA